MSSNITSQQLKHKRLLGLSILAAIIIAVLLIQYFNSSTDPDQKNGRPIAVVTATAQQRNIPVYLSALGTVTPTYSVIVRTQINGRLLHVLFREGQMVKAGDLLAEIDPRPYQAQLLQYQGQLARDQAALTNSQLDLKRYQKLWKEDSVSKQTLDTQAALVKQNEGTVKLDQGLIAGTQVNLTYCEITAPVAGRVGLRQVDAGNVVQTSDPNGLVVLNTLNPISVVFSLPQDNIAAVMAALNAGTTLQVFAYNRDQNKLLATGTLLTVDNQIDPTTGTVKLKASFANTNNQLFPAQFVNIRLLINTLQKAIVIPTAAVQHGVQNSYVYVVNSDQTVSSKPIVTSINDGENTVITSGISLGQTVVVDGADKLIDGATVAVTGSNIQPLVPTQKHHRK